MLDPQALLRERQRSRGARRLTADYNGLWLGRAVLSRRRVWRSRRVRGAMPRSVAQLRAAPARVESVMMAPLNRPW